MPTTRQEIIQLLSDGTHFTVTDISQIVGIREKDVLGHLEHIARSVKAGNRKLIITPPECLFCGFIFKSRDRFSKPSRCPKCKSERIRAPYFRLDSKE